jgi:hypothetical protein
MNKSSHIVQHGVAVRSGLETSTCESARRARRDPQPLTSTACLQHHLHPRGRWGVSAHTCRTSVRHIPTDPAHLSTTCAAAVQQACVYLYTSVACLQFSTVDNHKVTRLKSKITTNQPSPVNKPQQVCVCSCRQPRHPRAATSLRISSSSLHRHSCYATLLPTAAAAVAAGCTWIPLRQRPKPHVHKTQQGLRA